MDPVAETQEGDRKAIARSEELGKFYQQLAETHGVVLPKSLLDEIVIERVKAEKEAKEREHKLEELARIDPLTGFYNRRMFGEGMETAVAVVRRTEEPAFLLGIDLDEFDEINSKYGHGGGDEALVEIAAVLAAGIRPTDRIFRAGEHGDEFMIILPITDMRGAVLLAERIRDTIEHLDIIIGKGRAQTTVSIGISPFGKLSPQEISKNADVALYEAKRAGKNIIRFMDNNGDIQIPVIEDDPKNPGQNIVRLEPALAA